MPYFQSYKRLSSDPHCTVEEADTKDQILYNSAERKVQDRQVCRDRKLVISVCLELEAQGNGSDCLLGARFPFGRMKMS